MESLLSRVCWKVALLKRLLFRCYLPLHTFFFVYTALFRPCPEYATVVWDDCSSHESNSLERTLGWPTLAWRRRRSKLLLFWQLVHGLGPPCLQDKLSSASSRCNLRNPKSMEGPLCSASAHLSSFLPSYSCSILWNTLPASVTSCSSLSSFASSLDSFFVDDKFSYGLPP